MRYSAACLPAWLVGWSPQDGRTALDLARERIDGRELKTIIQKVSPGIRRLLRGEVLARTNPCRSHSPPLMQAKKRLRFSRGLRGNGLVRLQLDDFVPNSSLGNTRFQFRAL